MKHLAVIIGFGLLMAWLGSLFDLKYLVLLTAPLVVGMIVYDLYRRGKP